MKDTNIPAGIGFASNRERPIVSESSKMPAPINADKGRLRR